MSGMEKVIVDRLERLYIPVNFGPKDAMEKVMQHNSIIKRFIKSIKGTRGRK